MKIKELREWINTLPETFDDYEVVKRRVEKDLQTEGNLIAHDTSVVSVGVDEEHQELCMYDEDSYNLINPRSPEETKEE